MCDGCIKDIQECLDELPGYKGLLELFKGYKPGSVGQSKVHGSTEPSIPYNITVADLLNEIDDVIYRTYEYKVRDLVTLNGGPETAMDIRKAHLKADGIIGLKRVWERRRVPCPECNLPTLGGWVGDARIYCTNSDCGEVLTKDQYEEYCEKKSKEKRAKR